MLANEVMEKLARKHQTTRLNIEREYFQHLFLSYFYRQKESEQVFFKGGTALRILYKSPRFSEDLDFSSTLKSITVLEDMVIAVLREIEREGIIPEIIEVKETSGGYLGRIAFKAAGVRQTIGLEISLREGEKRGEQVTVVSDFMPTFTVMSLIREQLVEEKIQALLSRQKPRDFYDLYFILRADLLPPSKKEVLKKVQLILSKAEIPYEKELKVFLPQTHWPVIRDFKRSLESEMERHS